MIRVMNWERFQSYKDRKPPWIRMHKSLLDCYDFQVMTVTSRAILPMLWLLASEDEDPKSGLIKDSVQKIAFRLRLTVEEIEHCIEECSSSGFVEKVEQKQSCNETVTKPLQSCQVFVTPETETETEKPIVVFDQKKAFSEIWAKYPNKDGKKAADKHFKSSVKTSEDFEEITKALSNYLASEKVKKGFIKNGSTWFNNWQDWIVEDCQPVTEIVSGGDLDWRP